MQKSEMGQNGMRCLRAEKGEGGRETRRKDSCETLA